MDNVETIRSGYEAFARGDMAAVFAVLDPAIEWTVSETVPFGGTYRGHEALGEFFVALQRNWRELRVEPERFLVDGDGVVVLGRHHAHGAGGIRMLPFAHVWTLRDGKAVRFFEITDTALGLEALGGVAAAA